MLRLISLISIFFLTLSVCAFQPTKWNARYQQYIDQYKDLAIAEMLQWNIPASITMAQGLLESGAGNSELSRKGNNHFGIKCHGWAGRTTYHDDDEKQECFRAYDNVYESYEDHSRFLSTSPRYKRLFSLKRTDYKGWARGLKACGYATNPRYAELLIDIIECYDLQALDRATTYNKSNIHRGAYHPSKNTSGALAQQHHQILMNNRLFYIVARRGDTFKSLGEEFGVSERKLADYNDRDKKSIISEGDYIYLQKKRSKADKAFKKRPHIVAPGESLYDISQRYGIRLKKLIKKNPEALENGVRSGDKIRIY